MSKGFFEQFRKGDDVYFVSEMAEKLSHLQGTLLEDITSETREVKLLNAGGGEVTVGSRENPEWNNIEVFQGFGLLFLKLDSDRVVYVVVSSDENSVMLEPLLDI